MNLNKQPLINLKNIYVEGVDTSKRASSLRQFLFAKDTLFSVKIPILNNVSFTANVGDRIGIIGRNGSGKSSLLKTIAGIYPIAKGNIEVYGKVAPLIEMGVGFDYELSGRANIKLALCYSGRINDYSLGLEKQIIEFSELQDKIDLPLKTYSSGMVARLAFSTSVFQYPDILLLDEVLATGDAAFVQKSYDFMKRKLEDVAIAIIVHHSLDTMRELCNKCVLMDKGNILKIGHPEEIIAAYHNQFIQETS